MLQPAALQVGVELLLDVIGQVAVTPDERGQELRVVALHQLLEQRGLRPVALLAHRPGREQRRRRASRESGQNCRIRHWC